MMELLASAWMMQTRGKRVKPLATGCEHGAATAKTE